MPANAKKKAKRKRTQQRRQEAIAAVKADFKAANTEPAPEKPIKVGDANFEAKVARSPLPVLVDFWASWCGPCRSLAPSLERLAKAHTGRLVVAKYNTEENKRVGDALGIRSLPTMLLFRGGEVVDRLVGAVPYPRLEKWVLEKIGAEDAV